MRTTIDIPEDLLSEVQRVSNAPTRREALVIALEDYLRRQRLKRIVEAAGSLEFDLEAGQIRRLSAPRVEP